MRKHLIHHYYLSEDHCTECGACGAKHVPEDMAGTRRFMDAHWKCKGKVPEVNVAPAKSGAPS